LAKAMAIDRCQRYQSAQEMWKAMRKIDQAIEAEIDEKERLEAERRREVREERKRREEEARQREIEEQRRRENEPSSQVEPRSLSSKHALIVVSVLAVAIIAVSIYQLWPRQSPPAPNQTDARRAEIMRYSVEREGVIARFSTLNLASNKGFRLHFTPRENGYLYLLSPEEEGANLAPRLFAQPVSAGVDFGYPDGWLDPDPTAKQVRITVVFSPERIMLLDFLSNAALDKRPLNDAEQQNFQNFRNLAAQSEPQQVDSSGDNPAVVVTVTNKGQPLVFEIVSRSKPPGG
jgi:hypothetical protein